MLVVSKLRKSYGGVPVLDNVSFEIPEGTVTGIIGPNGAGKSTLLKIITGFETPESGQVQLMGKKVTSFYEKMSIVSYMPEYIEIYPEYYVFDFIDFVFSATRHKDTGLVTALNLGSVGSTKIKNLSKGYKQRLKLLIALANTKPLLVLDEPFDGFDPIQLLDILELVKAENRKGRTFLLSIHQLGDAEKICDYYILLSEGRLVARGSIEELRKDFGTGESRLEEIFMAALI